jgi:hypothetical protein
LFPAFAAVTVHDATGVAAVDTFGHEVAVHELEADAAEAVHDPIGVGPTVVTGQVVVV